MPAELRVSATMYELMTGFVTSPKNMHLRATHHILTANKYL